MNKVFLIFFVSFWSCVSTSYYNVEIDVLGDSKDIPFSGYEEYLTSVIGIHIVSNSSHKYRLCLFGEDSIPEGICNYHFRIPAGKLDTIVGEEWYNSYTIVRYLPSSELATGSIKMRVVFNRSLYWSEVFKEGN